MKYINKIKLAYGSVFLTDSGDMTYNVVTAANICNESFRIITPTAVGRVDSYDGTIRENFNDLLPLCNNRLIYVSHKDKRILEEYAEIDIGFDTVTMVYDYSFMFDQMPNLVGKHIVYDNDTKVIFVKPYWAVSEFKSRDEYLNSKYAPNLMKEDIHTAYRLADDYGMQENFYAYQLAKMIVD